MSQSVKGRIKVIGNAGTFGKTQKKSLVITTNDKFPQTLEVEFLNDKINLIDGYDVGENVEINVNIRGREWINPQGQTKYFTSLQGWKIDREAKLSNEQQNPLRQQANTPQTDDVLF